MDKESLEKFINQIERISKLSDEQYYVEDTTGAYLKNDYLKTLASEAKELINYGEYRIALENILDNLNEVSITLDKKIIDLARDALGESRTVEMELLLDILTK